LPDLIHFAQIYFHRIIDQIRRLVYPLALVVVRQVVDNRYSCVIQPREDIVEFGATFIILRQEPADFIVEDIAPLLPGVDEVF
jgi:hypothetical protein